MIKKISQKIRDRFLKPIQCQLEQTEAMLKVLADTSFRTRAMFKRAHNNPINVLFVCHEPALWSMFESVYKAMEADLSFSPLVVALQYKHDTLQEGQYKDAGMFEFCESRKVKVIQGYDKEKNEWLNPVSLMPDYVFFQTPYNFFPPVWSVAQISMMAKVCYIPYGTTLFRGDVEDVVHPSSFFRYTHIIFKDNFISKEIFVNKFKNEKWFDEEKIILSGLPKLDRIERKNEYSGAVWKRGLDLNIKRILWTPRWTTAGMACHFFDYKEFFHEFCEKRQDVDFVFRPHPLCFQNFIINGEITKGELDRMEQKYYESLNMNLDRTGDYQDTFLTTDILISDLSSMMLEFLLTEKPIIYTHRVDLFNKLGRILSDGFYWVKNSAELKKTLEMLISGNDPIKEKRKELMKTVLFMPKGGAGLRIKEVIQSDFNTDLMVLNKVTDL